MGFSSKPGLCCCAYRWPFIALVMANKGRVGQRGATGSPGYGVIGNGLSVARCTPRCVPARPACTHLSEAAMQRCRQCWISHHANHRRVWCVWRVWRDDGQNKPGSVGRVNGGEMFAFSFCSPPLLGDGGGAVGLCKTPLSALWAREAARVLHRPGRRGRNRQRTVPTTPVIGAFPFVGQRFPWRARHCSVGSSHDIRSKPGLSSPRMPSIR